MTDNTLFRCRYCGATEQYDDSQGFYLLEWFSLGQDFDVRHAGCRPATVPHPAATSADGREQGE